MAFKTDNIQIKTWREERQWSQEHLADVAGIGLRTVQRIENGERASAESLKAIAAAFGVDVLTLLVDQEAEEAKIITRQQAKGRAALRFSFWLHLIGFVICVCVFTGISVGVGGDQFVMRWPLIWCSVAIISHGATVLIVELVSHFSSKL